MGAHVVHNLEFNILAIKIDSYIMYINRYLNHRSDDELTTLF